MSLLMLPHCTRRCGSRSISKRMLWPVTRDIPGRLSMVMYGSTILLRYATTIVPVQLDVRRYKCAIVLCDALWLDPDADDLNGIEVNEKRDFLRLDAMIMMAQLNVRKVQTHTPSSPPLQRLQPCGHACKALLLRTVRSEEQLQATPLRPTWCAVQRRSIFRGPCSTATPCSILCLAPFIQG